MIRQRLAVIACEALPLEGVILRDQLYVSGLDVILTRDPWMHRVDIARATGREMELTPEHDGRMIADVVAEWARRHGKPFHLVLTGPAGGEYVAGAGGEQITIDAVEFCRTLAGRATGAGLLTQEVPF